MATPATPVAQPPRAVSPGRQLFVQTRVELTMTLRQGERVLVTLFIPVLLLIFFSALKIIPVGANETATAVLLPGVLALAIMAAGMVSLGIATAYERHYGVLKRLGCSPLSRACLLVAKVLSVLALELIQAVLLLGVAALFYGWHAGGSLALAVLATALGTATFAALGLAMAGGLRAEATLASANALYLLFLLLGGGILPLDHLPVALATLAQFLPAAALTRALQGTMLAGQPFPGAALLTLALWMVLLLALAIKTFKWE
jgi:ABC-2 type transport system permease protein